MPETIHPNPKRFQTPSMIGQYYVLVWVGIHFHQRQSSFQSQRSKLEYNACSSRVSSGPDSPSQCWKSVGMGRCSAHWRGVGQKNWRGVNGGMAAALLISALLLACAHGQGDNAGILRFPKYWPIIINGVTFVFQDWVNRFWPIINGVSELGE